MDSRLPRLWPMGMLGAVALVALIERSIAAYSLDITPPENWNWRVSSRAAEREAPKCDVLCLGTSMTHMGIVPRVIEKAVGLRAYNFGLCAGSAPAQYFLLRKAIDAGARPRAILVDYHPQLLTVGPRYNIACWPDLATLREAWDLATATRDPDLFATLGLARLLPSVKDRQPIRGLLVAAMGGRDGSRRSYTAASLRNYRRNLGAHLDPKNPGYRGEIAESDRSTYLPRSWRCEPVNLGYIRRTLDLAESRGINVFWVIPPTIPQLQALREQRGLDALYTGFAREILAHHPNLVVIDGRRAGFRPDVFVNAAHLDREGAVAMSAGVGEVMALSLSDATSRGRWVSLPAYRKRAVDVELEDLGESIVALGGRWGTTGRK